MEEKITISMRLFEQLYEDRAALMAVREAAKHSTYASDTVPMIRGILNIPEESEGDE